MHLRSAVMWIPYMYLTSNAVPENLSYYTDHVLNQWLSYHKLPHTYTLVKTLKFLNILVHFWCHNAYFITSVLTGHGIYSLPSTFSKPVFPFFRLFIYLYWVFLCYPNPEIINLKFVTFNYQMLTAGSFF